MMLSDKDIRKNRKLLSERDRDFASTLRVIGDINRYRIFLIVMEVPLISVSSIAKILDISAPLTSQHIKALTGVQLLKKSRSGKIVYLQLDLSNPMVEDLIRSIRNSSKKKALKKEVRQGT